MNGWAFMPPILAGPASPPNASDLGPDFFAAWRAMSARLRADPLAIAAVAHAETGLSASIYDPRTNAGGLIGFMPSILQGLGWRGTPEEFRRLRAVDQIPYVERYYAPYRNFDLTNPGVVYAINFLPARVARAQAAGDVGVLTQAGENYYDQNRILDRNGDGSITIGDLRQHLSAQNRGPRWDAIRAGIGSQSATATRSIVPLAIAAGALGAWWLYLTDGGAAFRQRARRTRTGRTLTTYGVPL